MAEYISKFNTSEGAKQVDYNALGNLPTIPSKTSDLNNDSNFISSPETATVGQVLEVEAVDETGKPTSWKVVNMPESLPNPHALTFTGAVDGTYDGSEAKIIEIPSVSGGGGEWQLINSVITTEEVSSIEISTDSDGNTFELDNVRVITIVPYGVDLRGSITFKGMWSSFRCTLVLASRSFNTHIRNICEKRVFKVNENYVICVYANNGEYERNIQEPKKNYPTIGVCVTASDGDGVFPVGTIVGVFKK